MKTKKIWFDHEHIFLEVENGKIGSLELKDFPRLYNATHEQRMKYNFSPLGIHWPELDEDLSFEGFFYEQQEYAENDVSVILNKFPEINAGQLAKRAGINQDLLTKYACGIKKPSPKRLKEIKKALHDLGEELVQA